VAKWGTSSWQLTALKNCLKGWKPAHPRNSVSWSNLDSYGLEKPPPPQVWQFNFEVPIKLEFLEEQQELPLPILFPVPCISREVSMNYLYNICFLRTWPKTLIIITVLISSLWGFTFSFSRLWVQLRELPKNKSFLSENFTLSAQWVPFPGF
jgi:hypothetical protein